MPERVLEIQALTPLLFRDGRPFAGSEGSETVAQSLPLPLPRTVAGFVRTQLGKRQGVRFRDDHEALQRLHGLQICSPLLVRGGEFVLPAPRDAVLYRKDDRLELMRLKPLEPGPGSGCDNPEGLWPLEVTEDLKPESGYRFWRAAEMTRWLLGQEVIPQKIGGLPSETRVHVGIDKSSGKAEEGMLYSVTYKVLESLEGEPKQHYSWSLRARVKLAEGEAPEPLGFLGGEARPVRVSVHEELSEYWFDCPPEIKEAFAKLKAGDRVRLVLATPALFEGGWKPGWIEKSGTGELHLPRGLSKVKLKLLAAAVGRREPLSGWSLRENRPRPVRWMVPAGSVYFFEVLEGNPADLLESWLRPVSDDEQDRKDGFGLALWGVS